MGKAAFQASDLSLRPLLSVLNSLAVAAEGGG